MPRFRYPFLSPLPHDSQAWESLLGSPVAGAHGGLSPQMYDMPVVHKIPAITGQWGFYYLTKISTYYQYAGWIFHGRVGKWYLATLVRAFRLKRRYGLA